MDEIEVIEQQVDNPPLNNPVPELEPTPVLEPNEPVEEKIMNIFAELEARIEYLEANLAIAKSGMPSLPWK